ncbi:BREX system P-loop protein BrxC [Adlercreutzia agrestimuris]|uniref:BREX system P-loop protein BrxC n=1 Tax=Adlercreutzia agrestimuris TaxID=2941324 RepID=UPI00203BF9B8|nr:BREX system P-loop protein BrxC [Adlercreutzia agrestimuris]
MEFKEMYAKPIDRAIDPVVKAGSEEHLANELEEYVVTPEIQGHLLRFFDEYNDVDATGNGAWISGFFGSGKSHMLKILAVLLEDRTVEGMRAFDYILPKVKDSPSLHSAMEVAREKHPSESILFNIDSVAPNQGRTEAGALLAAFIKSFNSHLGYFDGDQQHIAKLEYDLDKEGHLESFKQQVQAICGKPWEDVRKSAALHAKKIDAAFDAALGNPEGATDNIIRYYKDTYQPSVKDFALQVKDYIDTKEPGFRLNFFVDEVGQFIANNTELMVNLQTVAEDLNDYCDGASWVLVTSQENVEDIVGEMSENSANDFSKIQARFKIKIQLTSSDAKTVIKQRLLAKNPDATPALDNMYDSYKDDFRVLFDFADGSKSYKVYADADDFVDTYPFVPYQFDLFITAMRGLSDYNGFTGRHHSTGARSMLGVFQEVAIRMANGLNGNAPASTEEQALATFDLMFEGLRNSLKSEVYGQITIAEGQLTDDPLAIRVLKALLLVKYCKDFKATAGNLRVLLYGSFKENTSVLEQNVKDALSNLERQVYIRRNNNVYEYLTDEEKDIEREIRNTSISTADIEATIAELVKEAVGSLRATYKNGAFEHVYPFNLKVDGNGQGIQRNDLSVDILTSWDEGSPLSTIPSAPKTLSVALMGADSLISDIRIYKQTEKYANVHGTSGEVRAAILMDKRDANMALYSKIRDEFTDLLAEARYSAGGAEVTDSLSGTGKDALANAMSELVKKSYTGLQQVSERITDTDVYNNCVAAQTKLDGMLPEYTETLYSQIGVLSSGGVVTVGGDGLSSLTAYFGKSVYGWPDIVVRNAVAMLSGIGKIEVRRTGSLLEKTELGNALKKNQELDKLVVSKVADVDSDRLNEIVFGYKALTGTSPAENDAKAIARELSAYLENTSSPWQQSESAAMAYPFATDYKEGLTLVRRVINALGSNWQWIATDFPEHVDEIALAKEDMDKMRTFVAGSPMQQKWSEARSFLNRGLREARAVDAPIADDEEFIAEVRTVVEDPQVYKSSEIARVSGKIRRAQDEIASQLASLKEHETEQLKINHDRFKNMNEYVALDAAQKTCIDEVFEKATNELDGAQGAYEIKGFAATFMERNASFLLSLLNPPSPVVDPDSEGVVGSDPEPVQSVSISEVLKRITGSPFIKNEEDVESYIEGLKAVLLNEIRSGKVVVK